MRITFALLLAFLPLVPISSSAAGAPVLVENPALMQCLDPEAKISAVKGRVTPPTDSDLPAISVHPRGQISFAPINAGNGQLKDLRDPKTGLMMLTAVRAISLQETSRGDRLV